MEITMKIAVIDLGSNAVRMSIAEVCDKEVKVIKRFRENVRLSENMSETKMLQPQPVKRTIEALNQFKIELISYGVEKTVAVATAAMRNAKNKEVIINPLLKMGIELEIIDGLKEAYYDYVGVINTVDVKNCVIIDIGGASTELILVENKKNTHLISLPFGAVMLTEKYVANSNAKISVEEYVKAAFAAVDFLSKAKGFDIVAIGGTARSYAQIDINASEVPSQHIILANRIKETVKKISNMSVEEIRETMPVEKRRADILEAGFAILDALIDRINAPRVIVSNSGVREGVLYELAR